MLSDDYEYVHTSPKTRRHSHTSSETPSVLFAVAPIKCNITFPNMTHCLREGRLEGDVGHYYPDRSKYSALGGILKYL